MLGPLISLIVSEVQVFIHTPSQQRVLQINHSGNFNRQQILTIKDSDAAHK